MITKLAHASAATLSSRLAARIRSHLETAAMSRKKLSVRKKIGLLLLALVMAYWIAVPIIPFMNIPHKAAVIAVLIVGGEGLTLVCIALLGKEYWGQIKASVWKLCWWKRGRGGENVAGENGGRDAT